MIIKKVIFLLVLLAFSQAQFAAELKDSKSKSTESSSAWYLEKNYAALSSENRYFDTVAAINKTANILYLRASVARLDLVDGKRKTTPDTDEVILVSPDEFVVQPGESFPIRILANPEKQAKDAQSYYIRLTDVSNLKVPELGAANSTGFLLAYEILTTVNKSDLTPPSSSSFTLQGDLSKKTLLLTSKASQHMFLDQGYACPEVRKKLIDCELILGFPKQSLLPGESVVISYPGPLEYLGLMAGSDLSFKIGVNVIYIKNNNASVVAPSPVASTLSPSTTQGIIK